jgi:AcrR family transcriptional regulator
MHVGLRLIFLNQLYKPMVCMYNDFKQYSQEKWRNRKMKQEERRQKTIQTLLNATKELIQTKGCHSITMNDIMRQSNLSKGAIFHYVKSKDEIFSWVLQEQLDKTNDEFFSEVKLGEKSFEGPLERVIQNLSTSENQLLTNQVLLYLLGKENEPAIKEVLQKYYDHGLQLSRQWIESGQEHGVIKSSIDSREIADLFILIVFGYRVRQAMSSNQHFFEITQLRSLMSDLLKA